MWVNVSGGDIWLYGKEREGGVYPGADEALLGQEGLHPHTDHQQESQPEVLRGQGYSGQQMNKLVVRNS